MNTLVKIYLLRLTLGIVAALLCIGYLVAIGAINRNLILNSSLETEETGQMKPAYWASSENGTEWSTNYAKTGSRSIRINVNNASAEWQSETTKVNSGQTYQVQGFFKGKVTANQFSLIIKWFSDLNGNNLIKQDSKIIAINNYTQWSPIGELFTAPAEAKSCKLIFSASGATGDLYGDDFEVRQTEYITKFMNSLSLAIILYLVTFYLIKRRFMMKVEKQQKLFSTGIGIYFVAWLVFWILLYTLLATM